MTEKERAGRNALSTLADGEGFTIGAWIAELVKEKVSLARDVGDANIAYLQERAAHDETNQKLTAEILELQQKIADRKESEAMTIDSNTRLFDENVKLRELLASRPNPVDVGSIHKIDWSNQSYGWACNSAYLAWDAEITKALKEGK